MSESTFDQLCIQVQVGRAPGLGTPALESFVDGIARSATGARGINVVRGEDDGDYLNFNLAVERGVPVWTTSFRATLLEHAEFGSLLRSACIVVRTGEHGWDDYKLLYHYDLSQPLDAETGA